MSNASNPSEEVRRLYEEAESATAHAVEEAVSRPSFGELLARVTENAVALTKIGTDVFDLMLRNLRLAGRQDVTRLARQLARAEDKLELVLQEVERLNDKLEKSGSSGARRRSGGGARRTNSSNGRSSAGARRSSGSRSKR
jgi:uncharacterized membrane protein YgcG